MTKVVDRDNDRKEIERMFAIHQFDFEDPRVLNLIALLKMWSITKESGKDSEIEYLRKHSAILVSKSIREGDHYKAALGVSEEANTDLQENLEKQVKETNNAQRMAVRTQKELDEVVQMVVQLKSDKVDLEKDLKEVRQALIAKRKEMGEEKKQSEIQIAELLKGLTVIKNSLEKLDEKSKKKKEAFGR